MGSVWPHTTMATRPEDSLRWSYRAEKSTRQQSDFLKLAVFRAIHLPALGLRVFISKMWGSP